MISTPPTDTDSSRGEALALAKAIADRSHDHGSIAWCACYDGVVAALSPLPQSEAGEREAAGYRWRVRLEGCPDDHSRWVLTEVLPDFEDKEAAKVEIEPLFSTPTQGSGLASDAARSKVKDIINGHVIACLEAAGAIPLIPRHPGPAADAIIRVLTALGRTVQ